MRLKLVPLMLTVLILSGLDGVATLRLMRLGYGEANPIMQPLVTYGPMCFLLGKLLMTAVFLQPLWVLRGYRLFRTTWMHSGHVLVGLSTAYVALIGYEICLLTSI